MKRIFVLVRPQPTASEAALDEKYLEYRRKFGNPKEALRQMYADRRFQKDLPPPVEPFSNTPGNFDISDDAQSDAFISEVQKKMASMTGRPLKDCNLAVNRVLRGLGDFTDEDQADVRAAEEAVMNVAGDKEFDAISARLDALLERNAALDPKDGE